MLLRRVCSALSSASLVPLAPVVGRTPLGLAPRLAAATLLRSSTSTSLHGDASLRTVSTGQDSSSKEPKRPDAVGVALERLRKALPNLVNESCDLDFYTDDIVLENTISGMTLRGRTAVNLGHGTARHLARLVLKHPRIEVLSLKRWDDSTVHARWRVAGLSRATQLGEIWLDAFSIFKIEQDGRVSRHILSRFEPDREGKVARAAATAAAASWLPWQLVAQGTEYTPYWN